MNECTNPFTWFCSGLVFPLSFFCSFVVGILSATCVCGNTVQTMTRSRKDYSTWIVLLVLYCTLSRVPCHVLHDDPTPTKSKIPTKKEARTNPKCQGSRVLKMGGRPTAHPQRASELYKWLRKQATAKAKSKSKRG